MNRHADGLSPSGLKQLDRVTRRIVDDDLGAARPGDDFVRTERHAGTSQPLDLGLEITDLEMDAVPAARDLTPAVGERALPGAASPLSRRRTPSRETAANAGEASCSSVNPRRVV